MDTGGLALTEGAPCPLAGGGRDEGDTVLGDRERFDFDAVKTRKEIGDAQGLTRLFEAYRTRS